MDKEGLLSYLRSMLNIKTKEIRKLTKHKFNASSVSEQKELILLVEKKQSEIDTVNEILKQMED